jgi:hypothetical protein
MTDQEYFDAAMKSILDEMEALAQANPICPHCNQQAAVMLINGTMLDATITALCATHGVIKPIGEV